jgi:hypothetical protein
VDVGKYKARSEVGRDTWTRNYQGTRQEGYADDSREHLAHHHHGRANAERGEQMNTNAKQKAAKMPARVTMMEALRNANAILGEQNRKMAPTIASLRKANAKLRKELERVRDQCHEHWQNKEIIAAALHTEIEVSRVRQQNFETLASALAKGGR